MQMQRRIEIVRRGGVGNSITTIILPSFGFRALTEPVMPCRSTITGCQHLVHCMHVARVGWKINKILDNRNCLVYWFESCDRYAYVCTAPPVQENERFETRIFSIFYLVR